MNNIVNYIKDKTNQNNKIVDKFNSNNEPFKDFYKKFHWKHDKNLNGKKTLCINNINSFIKEGLKINSKTKVEPTNEKKIANILDIDLKYAKEIHDKYLNMNFLEIDDIVFANDLVSAAYATQFELIFMLCAMLLNDKQDKLDPAFTNLGTKWYRMKLGKQNPYDYSWFEGDFEDEDGNTWDILEYIKEQYKKRKDVEKNIQDAFNFCKEANINDPEKIWNFYEEY